MLETTVVTRAKVPFAGKREIRTTSLAAVRFERDDEGWLQIQEPCAVAVDGGNVAFPEAFVAALPARTDRVRLDEDGRYRFDPGPTWVGLRPGAALPEDDRDPNLVDHEGDGHPGATVLLQLPVFGDVRLYLAQVSHGVLDGRVQGDGITGTIDVRRLDQVTLGASIGVFAVSPRVEVVPEGSTFALTPDRTGRCGSTASR